MAVLGARTGPSSANGIAPTARLTGACKQNNLIAPAIRFGNCRCTYQPTVLSLPAADQAMRDDSKLRDNQEEAVRSDWCLLRSERRIAILVLLALMPVASGAAQSAPSAQAAEPEVNGSAPRGEALFTGTVQLRNRGPACVACHTIGGLSFPNGGTLGPDLTNAYRKLGPVGTQAAMQTLYFRVMTPIYRAHPLFPDEQADLLAFLVESEAKPIPQWNTQILLLIALGAGVVLVALTGLAGRHRVRSVRQTLIRRPTGQGVRL